MKEGRLNEAVDALKEAAPLDPENQEIRDKLAAAAPVEEPPPVDDISPAVEEPTAPAETLTVLEASGPEPLVEPEPEPAPVEGVIEPVAAVAEVAAPEPVPTASPDDALPLETFFEELRGKVARDQELRARELLDRGLEQLADNKMAEAIASFEEASRMPAMRFEASAHLARIFLARSDLQAAVDWMERALEAPAPAPEDRLEIMYDLADALARQGESSRAMALFMEVDSESSGYRDVRERIAHLSHTEIGNP
jgi:tetratricopeptide (TPR) repeat protein